MDLKETGCECVSWIHMARDTDKWRVLVDRKTKCEFSSFGSGAAGESVLLEYDTAFPTFGDNLLKVEMSKKNSTYEDRTLQCLSMSELRSDANLISQKNSIFWITNGDHCLIS
jgi:hypothetical protein